jgi:membrane protease YdiL (CAAX protease family)
VFVGLLALVEWAGRLSSGTPPKDVAYRWEYASGAVIQFALMLAIIAWIARGEWGLLALRRPRSWGAALGLALVVLVVVDLVTLALEPILHPGREQGLTPTKWEPAYAPAFAVFAFAVVVLAPLTEELAFRGLGYGLLRPFGLVPPIVGSSFLWAFAHGLVDALPVITLLGVGLAWIRHRQDSTIPGMILHATFNGIALAVSILA